LKKGYRPPGKKRRGQNHPKSGGVAQDRTYHAVLGDDTAVGGQAGLLQDNWKNGEAPYRN